VLEGARACLDETVSRGSTAEEREAAVAWLEHAARDEQQVARVELADSRLLPRRIAVCSRTRSPSGHRDDERERMVHVTLLPKRACLSTSKTSA
jgi:hypothetical protein